MRHLNDVPRTSRVEFGCGVDEKSLRDLIDRKRQRITITIGEPHDGRRLRLRLSWHRTGLEVLAVHEEFADSPGGKA